MRSKGQCQAWSESSDARCAKPAMRGSRYCWWHQSKVLLLLSLVLGAIISLVVSEAWRALVPSAERKELKLLRKDYAESQKKPELAFFLNDVPIRSGSQVTIPTTNTVQTLRFSVLNKGNGTADSLTVDLCFPTSVTNLLRTGTWVTQAPLRQHRDGKLMELAEISHYRVVAQDILAPGNSFTCDPLLLEQSIHVPFLLQMLIDAYAKGTDASRIQVWVLFVPGPGDPFLSK